MNALPARHKRHKIFLRTLASFAALGVAMGAASSAQAQIVSCTHGEAFDFNNSAAITFTETAPNSQVFEAQSVQNGLTYDFTVTDNTTQFNQRLNAPISGSGHNQAGGGATDGGLQLLGRVGNITANVDFEVTISGGFLTAVELYAHDIEDDEQFTFGAADYVANSLIPHPGALVTIDPVARTVVGAGGNTNNQSDRSAFAQYENINGVTVLSGNMAVTNGRIGAGIAIGTKCVSIIEAVAETFADFGRIGGVTGPILTSDTLNGAIIDPADVSVTPGTINGPDGNPSSAIALNNNGTITIPAGTPAGTYTVAYEVCDNVNTANCSSAVETVNVLSEPNLEMTKIADDDELVTVGQLVTYTYTVTNNGNVNVSGVTINDTHNGSGPAPTPVGETLTDNGAAGDSTDGTANDGIWDVLAPGDVVTFTGTYTVTQADIDNLQ